ncbi:hypothetical protein DES52_107152 [Deinococcus yavapaiensis KR-236]|uniref:Uncharacterized protein n=1 Tax=Deinococcus yavapaiensis KR-236 TaxID=694435 RepID=A0A318S5C7_9DEIO|nr:hypothetical protein DES52_107152 [Deinococcus yavapaiensis KR-236]
MVTEGIAEPQVLVHNRLNFRAKINVNTGLTAR